MFFLFGSRYYWWTIRKGPFLCPNCQVLREYRHRKGRRFVHVLFIPLVPISEASEHVRCGSCKKRFEPSLLAEQEPAPAWPRRATP